MFKKQILFLMALIMAIASANASTWKAHSYYVTSKIQNIYDFGDRVFFLNSNSLFEFDKTTTTTTTLGKLNKLSDNMIKQIYFDSDARLLFIAYNNSNIDVIDANDNVTNISSLKDIVTHVHSYTLASGVLSDYNGKEINDITFTNGKAYVATGYGYIVIDESTLRVIEDVNLNTKLNSVAVVGNTMVMMTDTRFYYGAVGEDDPLNNYTSNSLASTGAKMFPIDDNRLFLLGPSALSVYDFSSGTPTSSQLIGYQANSVQKTPTGYIVNFPATRAFYYIVDEAATTATKASSVIGCASCDPAGTGTVWLSEADGIRSNGSTVYYKPNAMTTDVPYWLKYNAKDNKLYAGISGINARTVQSASEITANIINTFDGTTWTDITPSSMTAKNAAGYEFEFDPMSDNTFVRASWLSGIHKVIGNEVKTIYTSSNAPIAKYKPNPHFDKYGNLWVVSSYGAASTPAVVLTADKVLENSTNKTDWFIPSGLTSINTGSMKRSRFIISKKDNLKVYCDGEGCDGGYIGSIMFWDNYNEDPTVDDYHYWNVTHFIDQNDNRVQWTYMTHMEEDKDGLIWFGHLAGLFYFDPATTNTENPQAIRPYVTKSSEGKGYLADGFTIYDIGVDSDNNKWIATSNNGLYFVSPDGSEIYNHFTTDNSDLPSNVVYSVECDTVNNRVFIYTQEGFAEYIAEGDAGALDFSNVYAFPNPVEPDFTGMIKIANLMENSYVTVTDNVGNVITQMGPVMGRALWDGCGADGERVPTGTYNIYAAQGSLPAVSGTPHARVMIIK